MTALRSTFVFVLMAQSQMYSIPPAPSDWGRSLARVLCVVFGLLGALPFGAGFWVKSEAALAWASIETSEALKSLVDLEASYEISLSLLPLAVTLSNVEVHSTDGEGPALQASKVVITPRIFSLIAGRIDIGDIEIDELKGRLVVTQGKLQNVRIKLPEGESELGRAPFSALSVSDAQLDLQLDGVRLSTGTIDVDVFVEHNDSFEVAVRMAETWMTADPEVWSSGNGVQGPQNVSGSWDGDVLCQLDARLRVEPSQVLVRRLSVMGVADVDSAPNTRPNCRVQDQASEAPGLFALRAHGLSVSNLAEVDHPAVEGSVMLRVPVDIVNRFDLDLEPFKGWVGVTGDVHWREHTELPELVGRIRSSEVTYGPYRLIEGLEGPLQFAGDRIMSPELDIRYGGGTVRALDVHVDPFTDGVPLHTSRVEIDDVPFPHLMRDVDVTANTIVQFAIDDTVVQDFGGSLSPLSLHGELAAYADSFEIFDESYRSPARRHMVGVNGRASIRGRFGVTEDALHFEDETIRFGNSLLHATAVVGFADWIELNVSNSRIDLADISPLVTVPWSGVLEIEAEMGGPRSDPLLTGRLSVKNLVFGGFAAGDLDVAQVKFRPLYLDFSDAKLRKGSSTFHLPTARFDFQTDAGIQLDAALRSRQADVRDFLAIWQLDQDPRYASLQGRIDASAQLTYVLGGPRDPCKGGNLTLGGTASGTALSLYGERFDTGNAEFELRWRDIPAGYLGVDLEVPGFQVRKGNGSLLGSLEVRRGGKLTGNIVATAVPLSHVDGFGELGRLVSGTAAGVASVSGTLDAMRMSGQVQVSPVIVGRSKLPASRLLVQLEPGPSQAHFTGEKSACGSEIPAAFDLAEFRKDLPSGEYRITGQLFGGQVKLSDVVVTQQRSRVARGLFEFENLQLGPLLSLKPEVALAASAPAGTLTGALNIKSWPLDNWQVAQAEAELQQADIRWRGFTLSTRSQPQLRLAKGRLSSERVTLSLTSPDGHTTSFDVAGRIDQVSTTPTLDVLLTLQPTQLGGFTGLFDRGDRVAGSVEGRVRLYGPASQLRQEGELALRDGEFALRGNPIRLTDANIDVKLQHGRLTVTRGIATLGGGQVSLSGSAPLAGLRLGEFRGKIQVKNAALPLANDVKLSADAELDAIWYPQREGEERARLPKIGGDIVLRSFEYARPVTMNADIAALTGRARRTKFESYDPSKDHVELDVMLSASGPLKLNNNLIDAGLQIDKPGLQLTGTDQRFGLRGRVRLEQGGRIRLRRSEFEIQSGEVRFDDATHIQPRVDVTAVTEYRRFSATTSTGSSSAPGAATGASTAGSGAGQWRISMHAYGDAENLKLDLTSQPKLSQDDIFLLLTLGLTRAELDQAQSTSLGESVALEALGSLTGADAAVTDAIPVIDEFKFGSAYSARTGRTEPTVTIGKRLTKRIRAYVTSGISESREVRSNLEWRLNPRMSVEGSYDNVNAISSSSLGNLGADVRWRLEFE